MRKTIGQIVLNIIAISLFERILRATTRHYIHIWKRPHDPDGDGDRLSW